MGAGWTTTGSLANSLDDIRSSARIVREYEGVMPQLVDKVTLGEGIGLSWQEITYSALQAQAITETTDLDNPQQIADALLTVTPTVVGIETFLTDRVQARINKTGYSKIGTLAQNAIQRKKDTDGLTIFQMKDLFDELVAGVGTGIVADGPTANVFANGFQLPIAGAEIYEDGNIVIDGNDDAIGGVFCQEGIVLVQGRAPRVVTVRNEKRGGGGDHVYHYDEYAYAERPSAAYGWVQKIVSDATAPTS
jgi:hypothetical protein